MLNNLPDKKKGDKPPGARHINTLNEAARRVLNEPTVGYGMGGYGGGSANFPPWIQRRAIIVAEDYELGEADDIEGVYEIRLRYYDGEAWATDDEGSTLFLDCTDTELEFDEDDKLVVYFDVQRDMYLPLVSATQEECPAVNAVWGVVLIGTPAAGTFT